MDPTPGRCVRLRPEPPLASPSDSLKLPGRFSTFPEAADGSAWLVSKDGPLRTQEAEVTSFGFEHGLRGPSWGGTERKGGTLAPVIVQRAEGMRRRKGNTAPWKILNMEVL